MLPVRSVEKIATALAAPALDVAVRKTSELAPASELMAGESLCELKFIDIPARLELILTQSRRIAGSSPRPGVTEVIGYFGNRVEFTQRQEPHIQPGCYRHYFSKLLNPLQ